MVQNDFDPYALLDAIRAGDDVDLIRSSVELVLQALIEAEGSGAKQSEQLLATVSIEALVGLGEQAPAAIEGIGLSAAMSHRLVLHPSAALVELGVAQLHDVEGSATWTASGSIASKTAR